MKNVFLAILASIPFNFVLSQSSLSYSGNSSFSASYDTVTYNSVAIPTDESARTVLKAISNHTYNELRSGSPEPYVRPFITDDARVVGKRLGQLESWLRMDKESGQQWFMLAYGPSRKLELSIGGVFGFEFPEGEPKSFSYGLPLVQAKYLFKEYAVGKGPGFGVVAGSFIPTGKGAFKPAGYGTFSFLTVSQAFGKGEKVLLHSNIGFNYLHIKGENQTIGTWGFGSQVRTIGGFHLVGEVFSGDPYVPGAGTAFQTGFRHFFSDLLQVDMTVGKGIAGEHPLPFWFSAGVRIVTKRFLK